MSIKLHNQISPMATVTQKRKKRGVTENVHIWSCRKLRVHKLRTLNRLVYCVYSIRQHILNSHIVSILIIAINSFYLYISKWLCWIIRCYNYNLQYDRKLRCLFLCYRLKLSDISCKRIKLIFMVIDQIIIGLLKQRYFMITDQIDILTW